MAVAKPIISKKKTLRQSKTTPIVLPKKKHRVGGTKSVRKVRHPKTTVVFSTLSSKVVWSKLNLPSLTLPPFKLPNWKLPSWNWPTKPSKIVTKKNLKTSTSLRTQKKTAKSKLKKNKVVYNSASFFNHKRFRWLRRLRKSVFTFFRQLFRNFLAPFIFVFRRRLLLTVLCLVVSVAILGTAYGVYLYVFKDLPSVTDLMQRRQILTTKILDRNGKLLYRIYKDENRTLIPLDAVPIDMIHATIAIEDKDFYSHKGFSFRGIVRAFRVNVQGQSNQQGGSTITQQLVKNTLLSPEKTLRRKIREILLSMMMESTYSKNEIIEMYFNEIAYGGSTYGVEEAAQRYFGKSARQLDLAESSLLAGLPAAPTIYSPFGTNPELAKQRQAEVLHRMVEDKYISAEQAAAAAKEELHFRSDTNDIQAPHFVMYIKNMLVAQYGEDVVSQGGLEVKTSLDLDTQKQTQEIVTKEMAELARLRISNGAALVTNPQTGEVLAMVGSKNYFDFANDGQVNVTLRPRQPGSSIKPLTYAIAMERGLTPASTILDEPVVFSIAGSPPYAPKNYDGRFHGNVTVREALASSYNIPAVKTLASIGINTMIDKAEQMGITTWTDRKRFGLSLTLGGGEVQMIDMAKVYGTFANYGDTVDINPLLEVKNAKGEVLYHNECALDHTNCPKQANLDPKVAYQITDILSDNNARTPAFGPRSVLYIPNQQVAVKTGTTNNLKDNWSIGYTKDRLVAVWVGNNDGRPMSYVASGITGASPIWNKIMRTQLSDAHPHVFPTPDGLIKVKVCVPTGTLECKGCPKVREDLFVPGTEPKQSCNPAQFIRKPADPNASPQPVDRILQGVTIGR